MDDDVKKKIEAGAQVIIICMPFARMSEYVRKRDGIIKAECMVCRGEVAVNPRTFADGERPKQAQYICAACAVDFIDADGGVERQTFAFTDAQKSGHELNAQAAEWVRAGAKAISPTIIELVRQHRDKFDASSSAKRGAN